GFARVELAEDLLTPTLFPSGGEGTTAEDMFSRTVSPLTPAFAEPSAGRPALSPLRGEGEASHVLDFGSLDAFRPIVERAPDPEVAEVQRREFFEQLHRWSRQ